MAPPAKASPRKRRKQSIRKPRRRPSHVRPPSATRGRRVQNRRGADPPVPAFAYQAGTLRRRHAAFSRAQLLNSAFLTHLPGNWLASSTAAEASRGDPPGDPGTARPLGTPTATQDATGKHQATEAYQPAQKASANEPEAQRGIALSLMSLCRLVSAELELDYKPPATGRGECHTSEIGEAPHQADAQRTLTGAPGSTRRRDGNSARSNGRPQTGGEISKNQIPG
jgi:hypothetical protein